MRIISGKYKGIKIKYKKNDLVRPTRDFVKEAFFNALAHRFDIEGKRVIDLCCGTGQLGLEALSRGAVHVTFVDTNVENICENIAYLKLAKSEYSIQRAHICQIRKITEFDLCFFDPPYKDQKIYDHIFSDKVEKSGLWCMEMPKELNQSLEHMVFERVYRNNKIIMIDFSPNC